MAKAPKRPKLDLDQLATKRVTKTALEDILGTLYEKGLLDKRVNRKAITIAVASHSSIVTPFGKVVQTLNIDGCTDHIEYIHPAALLWYLCTVSEPFAKMACDSMIDAQKTGGSGDLRFIMYQDGVVPGNPFRPDKARKVEGW